MIALRTLTIGWQLRVLRRLLKLVRWYIERLASQAEAMEAGAGFR